MKPTRARPIWLTTLVGLFCATCLAANLLARRLLAGLDALVNTIQPETHAARPSRPSAPCR